MAHRAGVHPSPAGPRVASSCRSRSSFGGARLPSSSRQKHAELRRGPLRLCASTPGESWSRALFAGAARARQFFRQGQQDSKPQDSNLQLQSQAASADSSSDDEAASAAAAEQSSGGVSSPSGSDDAGTDEPLLSLAAALAAAAEAAEEPLTPEEEEWQEWKKYMEELDEQAREVADIDDELSAAVAEERYVDAAALKKDMERFMAEDTVYAALMGLQEALEEERYADAAKIRDEAATGLVGWWVGRGEGDAQGHLLRVSAGYSRFVGQAYLPKEIAEVKGAVSSGQVDEEEGEAMLDNLGSPLLEVFLRRAPDGSLQRRAAALHGYPVQGADPLEQQLMDSLAALNSGEGTIRMDQDSSDGTMRVTVDLSGGQQPTPDPNAPMDLGFGSLGSSDGFEIIRPTDGADDGMIPFDLSAGAGASASVEATVSSDGSLQVVAHTESLVRLERLPAELRSISRDTFTIHIPDQPGDSGTDEEAGEPLDELLSFAKEQFREEAPTDQKAAPPAADGTLPKLLTTLANQAKSGGLVSPSREQMAQILSGVAGEIKEEPDVPSLLSLSGTYNYWRLPLNLPTTDPFDGLYMASYGEHGPELLRLYRETVDGNDVVVAQKLTGDENVPAGEITFRAPVGRLNRLDHRDMYPPEFAVTQRYKASGQVAAPGYTNKRWVPGELLVFSGNGMLTGSATLGFLWCIPGHRQFLVPLFRIDLSAP